MDRPEARHRARHRRRFRVMLGHTSAFTVDVSGGGFCTELMRVMRPGLTVEGSIQVNGKEVPFGGQVTWVKPGDVSLNLRGRVGIRFTRVPADLQRMLDASGN
jgi:hypothetical protein